ncbi:alpha/beta hydrolase [Nocardia sp. CA-128927]|uniref:alpha/beta hydrolase n=1 Tax=Nocardia sp. CA-128927 TaxID=3239975 RepID=UPI003D980242
MDRRSTWVVRARAVVLAASLCLGVGVAVGAPAQAQATVSSADWVNLPAAPDGSVIARVEEPDGRNIRIWVRSTAMEGATFPVDIQRPEDTSQAKPTLYLMNGAGGGVDDATWQLRTNVLDFLSDKDINVVQPLGGQYSYYTDWINDDPVLGPNKWRTYLLEELPPLIDAALGTNKVNAIAGLSMTGTSVLALSIAKPGFYRSVASYSGCAQTSDPIGQAFVKLTVERPGATLANMWGAPDNPLWVENDPYVHADKLRGVNLFVSSGSGLPGAHDGFDGPFQTQPGAAAWADQLVVGGGIEAAIRMCSANLQNRLDQLGIPATFDFTPTGTHSWGYWQDAFVASWPVLAKGLYS